MKVVAILLAVCVAGSLGGLVPSNLGAANVGAIGARGFNNAAQKAGDTTRDWAQAGKGRQDWTNSDVNKGAIARDWAGRHSSSAGDETSKSADWNQEGSAHNNGNDASNRAAAKNSHAAAARWGNNDWSSSGSFDKNQNWADNSGWRKGNKRHESIGYGFDKKFARNANEDGGFDAGSSLDDHALDDVATRQVIYGRTQNDHTANAANANRQNADRAASFGNNAWANAASADKFGRDASQAGASNANNQDWAEKRNQANTNDRYQDARNSRALDAAGDLASRDSNAGRNTVGFGAVGGQNGLGVAGKVALNGPYNFGVAGKGLGVGKVNTAAVGKGVGLNGVVLGKGLVPVVPAGAAAGFAKSKGASDSSSLWDNAQRSKGAKALGAAHSDSAKDSALHNQWLSGRVKGFNKDQAASLNDVGYAADQAQRGHAANTANQAWANADAAKAAQQGSHDLDEVVNHSSNNKWRQSDRDHKRGEWKKFFNNAGKGGQNWERLKYNRDQTDDAASADFAKRYDDASRWQDAHSADDNAHAAQSANGARAADAANRQWAADATRDASGADSAEASAEADKSAAQWGADNDRRKFAVDQSRTDVRDQDQQGWDRNTYKAGFDARAAGAGKAVDAGAGYGYGGYGYGYPASSYGNYGYGYPAAYNGYGSVGYGYGY